jgi:RimJ/RimL family protein N-acetyltransferase
VSARAGHPRAVTLATARLVLDPLQAGHADELAPVLDDPALHAFTGGAPATVRELRTAYARREGGVSPDGRAAWLNWVLRPAAGGPPAGTVQATVSEADGRRRAELAWVVATAHQGQGLATEAATAVAGWLATQGVEELVAHIAPGHGASEGVARHLGLAPAGAREDGERRWTRSLSRAAP